MQNVLFVFQFQNIIVKYFLYKFLKMSVVNFQDTLLVLQYPLAGMSGLPKTTKMIDIQLTLG